MKRLSVLLLAVAALLSNAAVAQVKIDEEGLKSKIAKSDADIANPKKNVKAATWLERGKVFVEAYTTPTNGMYPRLPETMAQTLFGKPSGNKTVKFGDQSYKELKYKAVTAYSQDGEIKFWISNVEITPEALPKAIEAYRKAYDLDKGTANKVKDGLTNVTNAYKQDADYYFSTRKYDQAAEVFRKVYELQIDAPISVIDTASIYNAGYLFAVANKYQDGAECLKLAKQYGYDNDGDIYYLLGHCYTGMDDKAAAKEALTEGVKKYPKNSKIVESLIAYYSTSGEDPAQIIPLVQGAIDNDPSNPELWGGLGRIYDKLGDPDKAIDAFAKSAELTPKDFGANFNLGLLYIKKGDKMNEDLSKRQITNRKEYDDSLAAMLDVYAQSIAPLERALAAKPNDNTTVELLKNVCFRLRDAKPEYMEKYQKYNELLKTLPAQQ